MKHLFPLNDSWCKNLTMEYMSALIKFWWKIDINMFSFDPSYWFLYFIVIFILMHMMCWSNYLNLFFQPTYVIHIFPSCDFTDENLSRIAPDMLQIICGITHLVIIIATVWLISDQQLRHFLHMLHLVAQRITYDMGRLPKSGVKPSRAQEKCNNVLVSTALWLQTFGLEHQHWQQYANWPPIVARTKCVMGLETLWDCLCVYISNSSVKSKNLVRYRGNFLPTKIVYNCRKGKGLVLFLCCKKKRRETKDKNVYAQL